LDSHLKTPVFSVIMPAYNASRFIDEAIRSVIAQVFQDWELIIINDGSTDGTKQLAEQYAGDPRIKIFTQENKGLGAARNTGMAKAKGSLICFLDADDSWLNHKLLLQHRFILNNPGVDVLFTDGYTFDQKINHRLYYHFGVATGQFTGAEMYRMLYRQNCIPVLSVCVKKEWCEKAGMQDEFTRGAEDWDYWLRLAACGAVFFGMSERLFNYRIHEHNMSAHVVEQQTFSVLILIKNYKKQLMPDKVRNAFFKDLIASYPGLDKTCRADTVRTVGDFITQNYENAGFRFLNGCFGQKMAIFSYYLIGKLDRPGYPSKGGMKKLFLGMIQLLFFRPYKIYLKHAHLLAIQFHRWKLGGRLETRGPFYLGAGATINMNAKQAKLITYGLRIDDFTRITLDRDRSYLLTGSEVMISRFCNMVIWEGSLLIGNNVSFNNYCSVSCMEHIEIGDDTWFGEGVRLYDHNHRYKTEGIPFTRQGMDTGKVKIGNNCWIGSNTIILQNVTIGHNCVIGANNLIYKSVPDNTIVKARAMELMEEAFPKK
jgi:teichuronic acid biosynthesis glycosyltransferase TuaG